MYCMKLTDDEILAQFKSPDQKEQAFRNLLRASIKNVYIIMFGGMFIATTMPMIFYKIRVSKFGTPLIISELNPVYILGYIKLPATKQSRTSINRKKEMRLIYLKQAFNIKEQMM